MRPRDGCALVTDRGRVVLQLLARGMSNRELALELGLAVPTAKWHVSRLLKLYGVPNRAALVQRAIACGEVLADM